MFFVFLFLMSFFSDRLRMAKSKKNPFQLSIPLPSLFLLNITFFFFFSQACILAVVFRNALKQTLLQFALQFCSIHLPLLSGPLPVPEWSIADLSAALPGLGIPEAGQSVCLSACAG